MAAWSSSYITALPDSAFACIDSSGRHYPHHDINGKIDLPHLRNALSRLGQSDTTSCGAAHLRAHAKAEGWRIRDYRTGRKAARAGMFTAAVAGAAVGSVAAGTAIRKRLG